jgi:hypothetical protein
MGRMACRFLRESGPPAEALEDGGVQKVSFWHRSDLSRTSALLGCADLRTNIRYYSV